MLYRLFSCALALLALADFLQIFCFQLIRVQGGSMTNTLRNGDILLVTPIRNVKKFRRGDVVICWYPRRVKREFHLGSALTLTQHETFVKRLAALPGDTVEIREGKLLVNGAEVPDPPEMGSPPRDMPPRTLRRNQYFVMGDNRALSHDSRASNVGPLSGTMLRGRVRRVVWPLKRRKKIA